jgi:hypothetical protein
MDNAKNTEVLLLNVVFPKEGKSNYALIVVVDGFSIALYQCNYYSHKHSVSSILRDNVII